MEPIDLTILIEHSGIHAMWGMLLLAIHTKTAMNAKDVHEKNIPFNKWISINDRLPSGTIETAPTVLITDGEHISTGYHEHNLAETNDAGTFFPEDMTWHDDSHKLWTDIYGFPKVSYWMELPSLPNGKNTNEID